VSVSVCVWVAWWFIHMCEHVSEHVCVQLCMQVHMVEDGHMFKCTCERKCSNVRGHSHMGMCVYMCNA
jgi:hypothetical protein